MIRRLFGLACVAALAPSAAADEFKAVLVAKGYVAASNRGTVSAPALGVVRGVHVREGDAVKVGDLLAALDDTAPKAELRIAEAKVKLADARLDAERAALDGERKRCELQHQRAKAEAQRLRKLGTSVSQAEIEAVEHALVAAELALKSAADGKVAVFKAEVEVARAELERAVAAVAATQVRAPFDGVVVRRPVTVGELVRAGDAIFEVVDLSKLVALVEVTEGDLAKIAVGQACRLTFGSGDEFVQAAVTSISPIIDTAKSTGLVKVEFSARKDVARVGGSVTVAFLKAQK